MSRGEESLSSKLKLKAKEQNLQASDEKIPMSSQFMDKQIMDPPSLSPPPSTDFTHLINNQDHYDHQKHLLGDTGGFDSNIIVPSYDFLPIRPSSAAPLSHSALDLAAGSTATTESRVYSSASDFKPISTLPNNTGFGSLDSIEPSKLVPDKGHHHMSNTTILSEIDRTMKKHTDTLLHVMEAVNARLTQLETRTQYLENLVDDLKVSLDNTHGTTDGKFRQLKNILLEVQSGVQLLKDKQEMVEAQPQLSKHHLSKVDPNGQSPSPVPVKQIPQFPLTSFQQSPSSAAAPSQPPSSQLLAQLPTKFSPQQEPYCPPPIHSQLPPPNQPPYQPPYQSQYPPQPPPSLGYNLEEQPSHPMQSYPPNRPGSAPSQHLYNPPQPQPSMYDGAGDRSHSGFPSGYSSEPYPFTGSPVASAKPPHISNSGTGYPQLSNPRPLPMASAVSSSSGSSSTRSESRVPIDDVIDRVTTMGFPRDQVGATVKKLTENGQAVDLNVVLDKLMNEGGAPPGGWSGGR
ncbi:hypothetical protein CARUB_v10013474mg [Capsella rubella]|uniref:DUF1421 domain-containing protein n=2 Tax=Capsella rubella TaxID=81985 RepID=R0G4D7_9BRAS|nr:hypothetical protein CARUB_v10013474mg [Capsella rubella]